MRERAKYFAGVEGEVVRLALAIAARVLHREAQLIRCCWLACEGCAGEGCEGRAAVLRVSVSECGDMASKCLRGTSESSLQVVGDERLGVGECVAGDECRDGRAGCEWRSWRRLNAGSLICCSRGRPDRRGQG